MTNSPRPASAAAPAADIAVPTLTPEQFADGTDPAFGAALRAVRRGWRR